MNTQLALKVLGRVMDWDDDRAGEEFRRLQLMASLKYDGYRDFEAGVRFFESLASWLQQFEPHEREAAYEFVTNRMVYIGPGEMAQLVGQLYTNWVRPDLIRAVAAELAIPAHMINASEEALKRIDGLRRRTLFLGLSDGARVDYIRHQNVGLIVNEQVVGSAQLDSAKWGDLLDNLQRDTGDPAAKFSSVYLVDDFIATGTTFFRLDKDTGAPKGKLVKFANSLKTSAVELNRQIFEDGYGLNIHHYVGTAAAVEGLRGRLSASESELAQLELPTSPKLTCGITLPESLRMDDSKPEDREFLTLSDRYYDPAIETEHTEVGGTDMKRGYGGCALPLVLDHNTPNNSLPLLWAETRGSDAAEDSTDAPIPAMRPLFRRRHRHI